MPHRTEPLFALVAQMMAPGRGLTLDHVWLRFCRTLQDWVWGWHLWWRVKRLARPPVRAIEK